MSIVHASTYFRLCYSWIVSLDGLRGVDSLDCI